MTKLKALIIDDSALIRNLVSRMLSKDPNIEVVGTALNGKFGLQKIPKLKPDIIILDIEMPEMNGIQFLEERKKLGITIPVIVLSSIAKKGAKVTMEALSLGASEFILKPSEPGSNIQDTESQIIKMVHALAKPDSYKEVEGLDNNKSLQITYNVPIVKKTETLQISDYIKPARTIPDIDIVSIGISTGGPNALREILPQFPADFPAPIVIVQHMPAGFTHEFAVSLDRVCNLEVKEAADKDIVKKGRILIAPGGHHIRFEKKSLATIIRIDDSAPVNGHKPSVDVLFESTAEIYKGKSLACIMTGMGKDGADKIGNITREGGITMAQDEETSIVFGMPQMAIKSGNINIVKPLSEIPSAIINILTNKKLT